MKYQVSLDSHLRCWTSKKIWGTYNRSTISSTCSLNQPPLFEWIHIRRTRFIFSNFPFLQIWKRKRRKFWWCSSTYFISYIWVFHYVLSSMIFKILLIFLDNVQFANCAMNFYFVSCRIPFAIVNMTNTTVLHTTLENINFYYKRTLILPSYMSQISVGRFSIL